jgi:hypothetical protein
VLFDKIIAAQVNLAFEFIPRAILDPFLANSRSRFCAARGFVPNCPSIQSKLKNGDTEASPAVAR